jgi:hypothetical protein
MSTVSVSAADWFSLSSPEYHWYLGAYGGYANNTLYGSKDIEKFYTYNLQGTQAGITYYSGDGWTVAIPVRYQIFNWLAVQIEPSFITKNYSWQRSGQGSNDVDLFNKTYQKTTNSFIDLPVMANLSMGLGVQQFRLFVNAGFFVGIWAASKVEGKQPSLSQDVYNPGSAEYETYNEYVTFDTKRDNIFDGGLLFGAGFQYLLKPCTFFVEWRFNYSLTDMQINYDKQEQFANMNDTWTLHAGVIFNAGLFDIFKRKDKSTNGEEK